MMGEQPTTNKMIIGGKISKDSIDTESPWGRQLYDLRIAIAEYHTAIELISNSDNMINILNAKAHRNRVFKALDEFTDAKRRANCTTLTSNESAVISIITGLDDTFKYKTKEDITDGPDERHDHSCNCCR